MHLSRGLGSFPWETIVELRDDFVRRGQSELEFYQAVPNQHTLTPVLIPRNLTDRELTKYFSDLLPRIRPPEFPEPSKAGRRGRDVYVASEKPKHQGAKIEAVGGVTKKRCASPLGQITVYWNSIVEGKCIRSARPKIEEKIEVDLLESAAAIDEIPCFGLLVRPQDRHLVRILMRAVYPSLLRCGNSCFARNGRR